MARLRRGRPQLAFNFEFNSPHRAATLNFDRVAREYGPDQGISSAFNWNNGVPAYDKPPFFDITLGTQFNGLNKPGATMRFGDADIGGKPPYYQNWNFGFERGISSTLTLGVNYVGSNGHFQGGGGRGIWSNQIDPRYLALGNLLQSQAIWPRAESESLTTQPSLSRRTSPPVGRSGGNSSG